LAFTIDKAIQNTVIFDWVPNTNLAMKNIIASLTDAQVLQACNDTWFDGVM